MNWIVAALLVRLLALGLDSTVEVQDGGTGQPPQVSDGGTGQPPKMALYDGGTGQPPQ